MLADHGRTGIMLVHFDGTHDGPYAGLPATGGALDLDMFAVVTFNDAGRAVGERVFLESADPGAMLTVSR